MRKNINKKINLCFHLNNYRKVKYQENEKRK